MDSKTAVNEHTPPLVEETAVPTVIAKKRAVDAPPAGLGSPTKEERNSAEIARLSNWATGECGKPILAD